MLCFNVCLINNPNGKLIIAHPSLYLSLLAKAIL